MKRDGAKAELAEVALVCCTTGAYAFRGDNKAGAFEDEDQVERFRSVSCVSEAAVSLALLA